MNLKEKKHAYLQKRTLDKALNKLIGNSCPYKYTYFIEEYDKNIVFKIEGKKYHPYDEIDNQKGKIEFNLPSIEKVIRETKKIYKNFDDSNIKNIN